MNKPGKEKKKNNPDIEIILPETRKETSAPLFQESVSAGFPSPAEDYIEKSLDLNEYLIPNPVATYFVRVHGNSMINAGIFDGDILIVDKSKDAKDGDIVIGVVNGEFTVKRILKKGKIFFLQPENDKYPPIEINEHADVSIWGVVTYSIHKV